MLSVHLWSVRGVCSSLHSARSFACKPRLSRRFYSSVKSDDGKPFMVTTPIFYVNGPPHILDLNIGHLYSAVIADTLVKANQLLDKSTLFVTGTDEHGMKVYEAAQKKGVDVHTYCSDISGTFRSLFDKCNIKYDVYIRTTEERHKRAVWSLWNILLEKGYLYEGSYEGWYCVPDEAFLTPFQVKEDAHGKMVSIESGHPVEWLSEKNWMFRLSAFEKQLGEWIESSGMDQRRINELKKSVLEPGLTDLSVSRPRSRIKWGIPVPNDDSQTIYVWVDALTNYLTATGCEKFNDYTRYPQNDYTKHWPADYHIIGKDILRFHAIYWPAFLMAAGIALPKNVLAHSHWTVNREKMSKSKGNVIDPNAYVDKFGVDPVRYFLLKEGGLMTDGDWSDSEFETKYNAELADTFGNLFSRSTGAALYPTNTWPSVYIPGYGNDADLQFMTAIKKLPGLVTEHFRQTNFQQAILSIFEVIRLANKYFFDAAPWTLLKKKKGETSPSVTVADEANLAKLNNILYMTLESLRILLQPVLPETADKVLTLFGVSLEDRKWTKFQHFGFDYTASGIPKFTNKVILFGKDSTKGK